MADLLKCPFCGGRADWWETESDTHRFQIVCVECCCGTDECVTEEVALKRWNARKPMEAVVAELEKESFEDSCGRAILLSDAERIVRGKE